MQEYRKNTVHRLEIRGYTAEGAGVAAGLDVAAGVDGGTGVAVAGGRAVTAGAVARGVGVTVIWAVPPAGRSSSGPPVREEYRNQADTPMAATQRSRTM